MKWLGLLVVLAGILPLANWLKRRPNRSPKIWMLIGFLPFVTENLHLYMAGIAWAGWPSYVRGAEFSVIDGLVLALYLSLPDAPHRPLPFRLPMALYFIAVLLASLWATMPEAALFYPCQLLRMFLVYMVATKASSSDPRVAPAILKGMAGGLMIEAGVAIWQRFGLHVFQTTGTFEHQNTLGMMTNFVVFPFFALLLDGRGGRLPILVVLAGCVIDVLTVSRGAIGIAGVGFAIVFLCSALRNLTSRKLLMLLTGVATIAVLMPLIISSIEQRGEFELDESNASRVEFNSEAATMLSDNPLGVGSAQYVIAAREGGYRRPGPDWEVIVHNVYLLVAVETGYIGLITFVVLLLCPIVVAFRCSWRNRRDVRANLLLALGVGLLTVYSQSFLEWVFLTYMPQYMFALEVGMVAGLAQQLGFWRRPRSKGIRLRGAAVLAPTNGRNFA
jgi:O-antigen ligase